MKEPDVTLYEFVKQLQKFMRENPGSYRLPVYKINRFDDYEAPNPVVEETYKAWPSSDKIRAIVL
jgi:hypothetical protein